ncbi:MAG: IMP cyclohydrolase [Desulfovibrio sp.]|jgi:phosphoribosylaminoimidazolecarboxamide formyltransferase/IMP cyclohydrolase|nr:IMP cyclohydrolase [Desulfovibrio sp.]
MEFLPIKRALMSATDKSGLADFAAFLAGNGVELVSTGGTRRMLEGAGLKVTPVSRVTGFPEILGGRVKTLHPHIHGGVLADKDNPEHVSTLRELGIAPFDLICVNLYDFATAAAKGLDLKQAVEEIDIGGPCMLRAAAKNYHSILVLPSPAYYGRAMEEMRGNSMRVGLEFRREMSVLTFAATAAYDRMIADYLAAAAR